MTQAVGSPWPRVLRALVFDAFGKRGTPAFDAAVNEIVDTYYRWPLVEYEVELSRAREAQQRRAEQIEAALATLRATRLPLGVPHAA